MVRVKLEPLDNEGLFTNQFLEEKVKNLPEWEEEDEIKEAFEEIKDIYESKKNILSSCKESQIRNEFINPVLKVLGFHLGVKTPIQQSAKQPDYALFKNKDDKLEAYQKNESEDFYQKSIAVADIKPWGVDFDKKPGKKNVFENKKPSFQMYHYLDSKPPDWGILTDGKKWRLHHSNTPLKQWFKKYYEIDLKDILEKFKYFYLFFRKKAFTPAGNSFLDQIYEKSEKNSEEIRTTTSVLFSWPRLRNKFLKTCENKNKKEFLKYLESLKQILEKPFPEKREIEKYVPSGFGIKTNYIEALKKSGEIPEDEKNIVKVLGHVTDNISGLVERKGIEIEEN
ncbi:hypothetical protein AKJ36_03585, partial [candidate division MSBL1 archaeon SCGC-AAA259I07]